RRPRRPWRRPFAWPPRARPDHCAPADPGKAWSMIEKPGAGVVLGRGLTKRCGRCGQGRLFTTWLQMLDRCPRCGLPFERGEGYWLGAMAVNLGAAEAAFGVFLLVG